MATTAMKMAAQKGSKKKAVMTSTTTTMKKAANKGSNKKNYITSAMLKRAQASRRRLTRGEKMFEQAHLNCVTAWEMCKNATELLDDALMVL